MTTRVVIIGMDGCLGSALVGASDAFRLALMALDRFGGEFEAVEVLTASVGGRPVVDGHGRSLPVDADLATIRTCAAFLVPGFVPDGSGRPPDLSDRRAVLQWIRDRHAAGSLACGSCSGVFLLGEAGLLDGRRCTTTWWLHDLFRQRFPRADAAFGSAPVEDGRVMTAGGPFSWIELVLALLRKLHGPEAARRAADFAVVDAVPASQAVYVPVGRFSASDPFLIAAEHAARQAGPSLTAAGLAKCLSVSERTLHRRLKSTSGETPGALLERIRFDGARIALETGSRPVKQVAEACGYADESSFRRAFRRAFGKSPSEYRIWTTTRGRSG